MFKWLRELFKHKHRFYTIKSHFHCELYDEYSGITEHAYYTYEKINYNFCIQCGAEKGELMLNCGGDNNEEKAPVENEPEETRESTSTEETEPGTVQV